MIPGIGMISPKLKASVNLVSGLTNVFHFEGDCNDYLGGIREAYSAPLYNNALSIHNYYANFYSDPSVYANMFSSSGGFQSLNMSFSVWVRNNGNSPFIYNSQTSGYGFFMNLNPNLVILYVYTSGGTKYLTATIIDSQWCHIAVTMKTNGILCLYVNGVLLSSVAMATRVLGSPLFIKRDNGGNTGSGSFWIDELHIWNRDLSQDEVTALYNGGSGKFYPTF